MNDTDEMISQFLGKPVTYWIELQRLVDRGLSVHETSTLELLLRENMDMRGKLSYIGDRVAGIHTALHAASAKTP